MKKLLFILILTLNLYAETIADIKAKIIMNVAHIITNDKVIKVYTDDPYFEDIFNTPYKFKRVYDIKDADIIVTNDSAQFKKYAGNKELNIISTHYRDYKKHRNIDVSAFFWQKGRPNLLLNRTLLHKRDIKVPKGLAKYLD